MVKLVTQQGDLSQEADANRIIDQIEAALAYYNEPNASSNKPKNACKRSKSKLKSKPKKAKKPLQMLLGGYLG
ncbi:hypothetical protein [Nostoc sp.]|uniref:hypothetical protein n=1 Tax=Nostoc sp. TaxID=1180 RepID=UPI002FF8AEB6